VATVNASGLVRGIAAGNAVITVTTQDGNKTATCNVTVRQPVTGVTFKQTAITIGIGETATLIPTVQPSNATNKDVTWSSVNTGVATVNTSGLVTAVAVGTTNITVRTQDGNRTANCAVTVVPVHKRIKITNIAGNITDVWSKNEDVYIALYSAFSGGIYDGTCVAQGSAMYDAADNSITFILKNGDWEGYWNGTGDYYITLSASYIVSGFSIMADYIYTNGQSLAALNITPSGNYNLAPKLNINTTETVIDMSKFKYVLEGSSQLTITGLSSYNNRGLEVYINDSDGYIDVYGAGIVANGRVTFVLSSVGGFVDLYGETNLKVRIAVYYDSTTFIYDSFNYTSTNPEINFGSFSQVP
jgi:hypothetical protein